MLRDVVLPYLTELGERWQRGTASVAQEHFASNLIRGRLAGLARGWGSGHGPRAVLACPPGELHDLALMVFGIVLNRNGWRIDYLGMSTPVEELSRTVDARHPDLVVLAATLPETLEPQLPSSPRSPSALRSPWPEPAPRRRSRAAVGARLLTGDPVTEAENIRVAAVNALAGGALGFADTRPCPGTGRNLPRRGRDNTPSRLLPRRQ